MRNLRGKQNLSGIILAVMAAGSLALSAVAARTTSQSTASPSMHKSSHTSKSGHSTPSGKKSSGKKRAQRVKGQTAPTAQRITEIQEALTRKGSYEGTPSGKWDDSTMEAVRKFQSSNGLNPTGKLDALTLQKLGLGSETAGLAAPTPPPNAINRLRNTASSPEPQDPDSEPRN